MAICLKYTIMFKTLFSNRKASSLQGKFQEKFACICARRRELTLLRSREGRQ